MLKESGPRRNLGPDPKGEGLDKERSGEWGRQVRKRRVQCSGGGGILGLEPPERVWEGAGSLLAFLPAPDTLREDTYWLCESHSHI